MKEEVLNLDDYIWVHNNYSYRCFYYKEDLVFISKIDLRDLINGCMASGRIEHLDYSIPYIIPSYPSLKKFVADNPIVKFQSLEYTTKTSGQYSCKTIKVELI